MAMISRFKEHNHYSRNIKISLILSELLIICVFLFSPEINQNKIKKYSEPLIFIDDIPITIQPVRNISIEPKTPEIFINAEIDEPVILDDIVFSKTEQQDLSLSNNVTDAIKINKAGESSPPRQLLEVLPDKKSVNYSGSLKLKLKINSSGKVADCIILFNSIDCEDCLKEIISAVYKSQWKPARKNGSETEFWVEKSYTFN
jgi:hypothetical protein